MGGTGLPPLLIATFLDKGRTEGCVYWDQWACTFQEMCGINGLGRSSQCISLSLSQHLAAITPTDSQDTGDASGF